MRWLFCLASLAACYSPHYENCEVTCASSHVCPSGLECDMALGRCHSAGATCVPHDDDAGTDALFDAPYPVGPWGMPSQVALSETGVGDATLTPDMLELYVAHQGDIYVATRSSVSVGWSGLAPVTAFNSSLLEQTPSISADGLTLMFSSDRTPSLGGQDIWVSTRASRASSWTTPVSIPEINGGADDSGAYTTPDQLTLVMGSTRGVDGFLDIYASTRPSTSANWVLPTEITELNLPSPGDSHPVLSPDQLTIYFQSNRNSSVDLFTARRATASAMFETPVPITELNTPGIDGDPWVSLDGHHMFFSRSTNGVSAIYETSR